MVTAVGLAEQEFERLLDEAQRDQAGIDRPIEPKITFQAKTRSR